MAPKLIKLAETPKTRIKIKAKSIANGITEATIKPARTFPKKMINTIKTINAPSIKLRITVDIFRSTNSERFK